MHGSEQNSILFRLPGLSASILGACFLSACTAAPTAAPRRPPTPPKPPVIHHLVLFDLANRADTAALIADSIEMADAIPGVTTMFAGTPAGIERPGLDREYDVAFCVRLTDEAAYRAYMLNPVHVAVKEKWQPRLTDMRVIDMKGVPR